MKKLISFLLVLFLLFNSTSIVLANDTTKINISIDGIQQNYSQDPVIKNGTTLVPLRPIFEALDATVEWEGTTKTITAQKGDIIIKLQIGSKLAEVNGQQIELIQAPEIINGNTMVPVRFISEALGADVKWDNATKTVMITKKEQNSQNSSNDNTNSNNENDNIIGNNDNTSENNDNKTEENSQNSNTGDDNNNQDNLEKELLDAVKDENVEQTKELLSNGANPNAIYKDGFIENTVLSIAIEAANEEIVKLLLDAGADPNKADSKMGIPPLFFAIDANNGQIIEYLLEAGASVNHKDKSFGMTPLSYAIEKENIELVQLFIDNKAEVNTTDNNGLTPLMSAIQTGQAEIVQVLIDNEAKVNSRDKNNKTPLMYAADNGNAEIVRLLLEHNAVSFLIDKNGWSALMYATAAENEEVVKELIETGANLDQKENINFEFTPLLKAADLNNYNIMKLLVEAGANVNNVDKDGWTPLIAAANNKNIDAVTLLIENGAELDKANKDKITALMLAADKGSLEIVTLLIDAGADVNKVDSDNWNAVMFAVIGNHTEVVNQLLMAGTKVDVKDSYGATPLMNAAYNGYGEIVKVLVKYGADIEASDKEGWNSLLIAVDENDLETVQLLIDLGANINHVDTNGASSVIYASYRGNEEMVKLLLDNGADPNVKDKAGWVALMDASARGFVEVVQDLIAAGANINEQNNDGMTALMYAVSDNQKDVVKLLVNQGADVNLKDKEGRTAIIHAAVVSDDDTSIIKVLYEAGADVNSRDNFGISALFEAIDKKDKVTTSYLLSIGAETNIFITEPNGYIDAEGITPLIYATGNGDNKIVEMLLKAGADPNTKDEQYGITALILAARLGYEEIVQLLLEYDVNLALHDQGARATEYAKKYGNDSIVTLLESNASSEKSEYKITESSTDNGYVKATGKVTEYTKWVMFEIKKVDSDQSKQLTIPVDSTMINYDVFLPFGAGDYEIVIYDSSSDDKDSRFFEKGTYHVSSSFESGYKITQGQDGSYTIDGIVSPEINWVWVKVVNKSNGKKKSLDFVPLDGVISEKIYLDLGAGNYDLVILESGDEDRQSTYFINTTFHLKTDLEDGYKINKTTTDDSMIMLEGTTSPGTNWVWVKITNLDNDKDKNVDIVPINGEISKKLYLNLGTGDYEVLVLESSADEITSNYFIKERFEVTNTDETDIYLLPSEMVESDSKEIIDLANKITEGLTTDYEKAKAIHDWVSLNISYDPSALEGVDIRHSALETLHLKMTDCDGYARLVTALLRASGIKAKFVIGMSISPDEEWPEEIVPNHAWNEAYVDGHWIIIDATWDSGYIDHRTNKFMVLYRDIYFDPNPEDFAKDHKKMDEPGE